MLKAPFPPLYLAFAMIFLSPLWGSADSMSQDQEKAEGIDQKALDKKKSVLRDKSDNQPPLQTENAKPHIADDQAYEIKWGNRLPKSSQIDKFKRRPMQSIGSMRAQKAPKLRGALAPARVKMKQSAQ